VHSSADRSRHRARQWRVSWLPTEALTDIEAYRDEETGDERVGQHPADDDGAEDAASNRARTGGGPQRHAAQDESERRHEEGAPAHTDAFERGVDEWHPPFIRDLGELDDEDRVLGGEANHHEQADLREDVELEAPEPERCEGAEHGDGRGEKDGE